IEEARPALEAALRDFEQLQSTHALVKDALEQARIAAGDVTRFREEQSETRTWLSRVEGTVGALRERVDELRKLAPTVEFVQKQAQRVNESMAAIEARREFVEDMQRRMAELGALGGSLDERGRDLQARVDAAEQRFVGLVAQAEEAERLGKAVASLSSGLMEAGGGAPGDRAAAARAGAGGKGPPPRRGVAARRGRGGAGAGRARQAPSRRRRVGGPAGRARRRARLAARGPRRGPAARREADRA